MAPTACPLHPTPHPTHPLTWAIRKFVAWKICMLLCATTGYLKLHCASAGLTWWSPVSCSAVVVIIGLQLLQDLPHAGSIVLLRLSLPFADRNLPQLATSRLIVRNLVRMPLRSQAIFCFPASDSHPPSHSVALSCCAWP